MSWPYATPGGDSRLDGRNRAPQARSRRPTPPRVAYGRGGAPSADSGSADTGRSRRGASSWRITHRQTAPADVAADLALGHARLPGATHGEPGGCSLTCFDRGVDRPLQSERGYCAVAQARASGGRSGAATRATIDHALRVGPLVRDTPWEYRRIALPRTAGRCYPLRALDAGDVRGSPRKPPNRDPRERVHPVPHAARPMREIPAPGISFRGLG